MNWKIKSSKYILQDKWISLRADSCLMPNGKIIEPYYVLEYSDWVNIVAITENNEIIMIKQYRHGIKETVLELCCGGIDSSDKTPLDAAKRELLEETGYSSNEFIELCKLSPNPANHNNYTYCYLALNCKKTHDQKLDSSEEIEIINISINEIKSMIKNNTLLQALHVASIFYAFDYLDNNVLGKSYGV